MTDVTSYPPCLPAMAMCFYSTSIFHSYPTSPNLQTGFLLLWIWSRNMCKCIWRLSIFLLLYGASASWLSPVVMGSLAIDRLLICYPGIVRVTGHKTPGESLVNITVSVYDTTHLQENPQRIGWGSWRDTLHYIHPLVSGLAGSKLN